MPRVKRITLLGTAQGCLTRNREAADGTLHDAVESNTFGEDIERKVKDWGLLRELSGLLLRQIQAPETYAEICRLAADQLGMKTVWVGLLCDGETRIRPVASLGIDERYLKSLRMTCDDGPRGKGPAARAIATLRPVAIDAEDDPDFEPWRKAALDKGYLSVASFPLAFGPKVLGTLNTFSDQKGHYTPGVLQTHQAFADLAANAIANARLLGSLGRQRDELRVLAKRLANREELERKQFARELHDQVGPSLTALSINLNILLNGCEGNDRLAGKARDCMGLLDGMTDTIRSVMGQLRPNLLDDCGLLAALRWYCEQFSRHSGMEVFVRGSESAERLPAESETAMFRIAQEALNNAAKHSRARSVIVSLMHDDGIVRMSVADNGIGFRRNRNLPKGWGLTSMKERAEAIGGACRIDSKTGRGTTVIVEVANGH